MKIYQANEVFTPTTPARVAFIERGSINDRLVNTLGTPGKQLVVYGHSGSGKTTLLTNKLEQTYEQHVTTQCMRGLKFDQLILDGFDQLAPYYTAEKTNRVKSSVSAEVVGNYFAIKAKVGAAIENESSSKQVRVLPQQLTPQALARFLGEAKCCWVLEDFHKVDEQEKPQLSQLMKVFMDMSDVYPELKIVALGAVGTARQVVDYDPEMRNRVSEIHVSLMTDPEICSIIEKGEKALNLFIGDEIKNLVSQYSNGLASVCHQLCLNMCHAAGIHSTLPEKDALTKRHLDKAVKMYAEETSDSITSLFDNALRPRRKSSFDNARLILQALSDFSQQGAGRNELLKHIRRTEKNYTDSILKTHLKNLMTPEYGGLIEFDRNSGRYSYSDPMYGVYALAKFKQDQNIKRSGTTDITTELVKILFNEFRKSALVIKHQPE